MPKKIGIDEKIAAQEGIVERAKAKLDAAEAKLGELKKKKEAEKKKELLDAIDASDKTVDSFRPCHQPITRSIASTMANAAASATATEADTIKLYPPAFSVRNMTPVITHSAAIRTFSMMSFIFPFPFHLEKRLMFQLICLSRFPDETHKKKKQGQTSCLSLMDA